MRRWGTCSGSFQDLRAAVIGGVRRSRRGPGPVGTTTRSALDSSSAHDQIADLRLAAMDESVIEPGHILRVTKNQPVTVPVFYHLIEKQAHLFGIGIALFHVYFRSLEQFAKNPIRILLLNIYHIKNTQIRIKFIIYLYL